MKINKIEMIIVFILESESILLNSFSKKYTILYLISFSILFNFSSKNYIMLHLNNF